MSNLETVAKLAGVSASTVSRVLTGSDKVAPQTRGVVLAAARQVGYQPNELARGLRQQGGRSIGLVLPGLQNPFHASLSAGVQDAADRHDLTLFSLNSNGSRGREQRALSTLRGHLPRGLIIVPTAHTLAHHALLDNLPVVELDRASGLSGRHSVRSNSREGAREATAFLLGLGHRHIGVIVGDLGVNTSVERLEGYQAALGEAGLPYDPALLRLGGDQEQGGFQAALSLLRLPSDLRPSALFVGNNEMTVGAVLAARELGLSIPRDLSLIGFDDSRLLQVLQPAISVVAQPSYQLGFTAAELLVQLIQNPAPAPPITVLLPTTLIHRSSTAPPA